MQMYLIDFFFIFKLVNWVISNPLANNALNNRKFSHVGHALVGLIMCLLLLKNRTRGFSMLTNSCISLLFT